MGRSLDHGALAVGIVELSEETFDGAIAATAGIMIVDFWAEWCAPCHAVAPILEELAGGSAGRVTLAKVNVNENPGVADRYSIRSIPTILFVKGGKVVERVIGATPKALLQDILNARA